MTLSKKIITTVVFIIFLCLLAIGDYFLYHFFAEKQKDHQETEILILSESNTNDVQNGNKEKTIDTLETIELNLKNEINLSKQSEDITDQFLEFTFTQSIKKTVYQSNTERDFITLYSFPFSGHDIAITKLQSLIRSQFKTEEADIFPYPSYGEQSWIIRLAKNQKKMYLVVAHEGRLLGIEYLLGENLSRHQLLESVLQPILTQ